MADPRYPVVMIGSASVVTAPPELDTENAEWFRKVLLDALNHGNGTVVVSMASTHFCDSAGVSALAWAHGHVVAQDAKLVLVIPAEGAVLRVFALAGLDRLIPIFADLNEALEQAQAIFPRRLRRQGRPSPEAGLPGGRLARRWATRQHPPGSASFTRYMRSSVKALARWQAQRDLARRRYPASKTNTK